MHIRSTYQTDIGSPLGNICRNQVTDAITNTTNLEVSKNIKWGERVNITWHMSMVNAFNHPNYGYNLGGADASSTFGGIDPFVDDASAPPRLDRKSTRLNSSHT